MCDTYAAKEIASILGVTVMTVHRRAEAESWPVNGKRPGKGGGKLYLYAGLPEDVQEAIRKHEEKELLENAVEPYTLPAPTTKELPLKDWQRDVRDARLVILDTVSKLSFSAGGILKAEQQFAERAQQGDLSAWLMECVAKANARSGKNRALTAATLRLWRRILKNGPDGLAPKPPRNSEEEIPGWLGPFCKKYCAPGSTMSVNQVYEELKEAGVNVPHLRTVERSIKRIVGPVELNRGRLGPREWKKMTAYSKRKFDSLLPGDVYTADGHKADLVVQHPDHGNPVRPEIISVIDIASRRCVGWAVEIFEHGYLVADAVRCAVEWAGIPAIWYVDNGCGFKNEYFEGAAAGALLRLGTTPKHSLPYASQARGVIEKFNDTCWVRAARMEVEAYVGMDKPQELRQKHAKQISAELEEYGSSDKIMSWQQFLLWGRTKIEAYNNRQHSTLPKINDPVTGKRRNMTPNERWAELAPQADIIQPTEIELDDIFRPYDTRTVRRCWIRLFNNDYYSPALNYYHGQEVRAGFDIHDPSQIWVRDLDGKFICVAGLDANARDYFPKSVIEQAREDRTDQQVKRLKKKEAKILEQAKPAIEAAPKAVVIDLPARQKQEAFFRQVEAEEKQKQMAAQQPSEKKQRILRALDIERRLDAGGAVNDIDGRWFQTYSRQPEYISAKEMIDAFGEEMGLAALG